MWPYCSGGWVWAACGRVCSWDSSGCRVSYSISCREVGLFLTGWKFSDGDGVGFSRFDVSGFLMVTGRACSWVSDWAGSGLLASLSWRRWEADNHYRVDDERAEKEPVSCLLGV